jgi:hypothetical protein
LFGAVGEVLGAVDEAEEDDEAEEEEVEGEVEVMVTEMVEGGGEGSTVIERIGTREVGEGELFDEEVALLDECSGEEVEARADVQAEAD